MTYRETVDWMFAQLPMYQRQGATAYRKDLTNTLLLMDHLGHPERKIKCIHVAGTNGKGSTSHMLASVLMEAGYKVGLYTSPHLKDYRERITINGEKIPEKNVVAFISENMRFLESNNLSFFEMTVGLAFDYFSKAEPDVCVIETGMGGRLDSTNVIVPMLSVITNIGMDHTAYLGDTIQEIATEKAGIIKKQVPVVIGEYTPETRQVFASKAHEMQAPIFFASDDIRNVLPGDLAGDYQLANRRAVQKAVEILTENFAISDENLKNGLLRTVPNTNLLGRWHVLGNNPKVVCDTAHNPHGLQPVIRQILKHEFERLHIVFGVVNDKDLKPVLEMLPITADYYFCRPNIPRGLDAENLQRQAAVFGLNGSAFDSVTEAYEAAIRKASSDDFIYVGGSTFVVAEIL